MTPAVFLDRDGVLLHDSGYLARREDLRWYAYAIDAVRLLKRAGLLVFVTTNQGGVGLGLYSETFVQETHAEMAARLDEADAHVDGWMYCPHHPRAVVPELAVTCDCRKPRPGMVHSAQAAHAIDLDRSFVVGDKATDMALAAAVGARGVFVRTGQGEAERHRAGDGLNAAVVVSDLMAATVWILTHVRKDGWTS
jgi:D-glycero-D-manno-heptose 1,7-bisphosphate phosphatase